MGKCKPCSNLKYEMVEDEEIFKDGELDRRMAEQNLLMHVFDVGDWIVMRRSEDE